MTNEELQGHINALNSAFDAGLVEIRGPAGWARLTTTKGWLVSEFRIRPQPREVYGVYDSAGNFEGLYRNIPSYMSGNTLVRFREVL